MRTIATASLSALALSACVARDPMPVATAQPQDAYASCAQIQAELMANNSKVTQVAEKQGWKTAKNVAAGAGRQQYLGILATERCAPRAALGSPSSVAT